MSFKIIGHEGMMIGTKTKRRQVIFNEDLIFMLFIFKFRLEKQDRKRIKMVKISSKKEFSMERYGNFKFKDFLEFFQIFFDFFIIDVFKEFF